MEVTMQYQQIPQGQSKEELGAIRLTLGILFMVFSLVMLISVLGLTNHLFFRLIDRFASGIAGSLKILLPIFIFWLSVILLFSKKIKTNPLAFALLLFLYLQVLAIFNLGSTVKAVRTNETYNLMEYVGFLNGDPHSKPNFARFFSLLYSITSNDPYYAKVGGALGGLLSWPLWYISDMVTATVFLSISSLITIISFFKIYIWDKIQKKRKPLSDEEMYRRQYEEYLRNYYMQIQTNQMQTNTGVPTYSQEQDARPIVPNTQAFPSMSQNSPIATSDARFMPSAQEDNRLFFTPEEELVQIQNPLPSPKNTGKKKSSRRKKVEETLVAEQIHQSTLSGLPPTYVVPSMEQDEPMKKTNNVRHAFADLNAAELHGEGKKLQGKQNKSKNPMELKVPSYLMQEAEGDSAETNVFNNREEKPLRSVNPVLELPFSSTSAKKQVSDSIDIPLQIPQRKPEQEFISSFEENNSTQPDTFSPVINNPFSNASIQISQAEVPSPPQQNNFTSQVQTTMYSKQDYNRFVSAVPEQNTFIPPTSPTSIFGGAQTRPRPDNLVPVIEKKPTKDDFVKKVTVQYVYPKTTLLEDPVNHYNVDPAYDLERAKLLEETLESFGITTTVANVTHGPAVTRFELDLASGINVKRINNVADNIALNMSAESGVRIEAPIPGTTFVGIEIPNKKVTPVSFKEVMYSQEMLGEKDPLAIALGKDITGRPMICKLAEMPHLLIAGATGSGKSVCINSIITSIIFRCSPDDCRLILIDPKMVELQRYNVLPHLLIPVVFEPHKASGALSWALAEMTDRYKKFQDVAVSNIQTYNSNLPPGAKKLPRIVVVIDELADLMISSSRKEIEHDINRIAALARAAGIHLVVATQRPSVDVITGVIKANLLSRIAFLSSSATDSRTILDRAGAENLVGHGDMLYMPSGYKNPVRVQGCFLKNNEINAVLKYIAENSKPNYDVDAIESIESAGQEEKAPIEDDSNKVDPLLEEAIDMVISDGQASISMLQRRMSIGYARAGRLIDAMTKRGVISKAAGSKPREVLLSRAEYEQIREEL